VHRPQTELSPYEQAAAWVVRLSGEPTPADLDRFERWRAQSPEHEQAFERAQAAWSIVGENSTAPELIAMRRDALQRAGHRSRRWIRASLVAALVLVIVVPIAVLQWPESRTSVTQELQTRRGEQRVIMLADGSRVSLDALTWLKVTYTQEARNVTLLEGRANFEVARDLTRPMNVSVGNRTVTALGTIFTVEREAQEIIVTLVEGRVAVASADRSIPRVEMRPRQQLRIDNSGPGTLDTDVDPVQALAWREGKLIFDDEPLTLVAARMNKYLPTPLVVEGAARDVRISGVFKAGDLRAFIDGMEGLFGLTAVRENDAVKLTLEDKRAPEVGPRGLIDERV
jgi:transmembrane sensor